MGDDTPEQAWNARFAASLLARGLAERETLERALERARTEQRSLEALLIEARLLAPAQAARLRAELATERAEVFPPAPAAPAPSSRPPWAPGQRVGDCVLLRRLGAGGMGVVYAVRHEGTGAALALKALTEDADEEARARFVREGQAQARVDAHSNVVKVHAMGEHAGRPYLVMDMASGGDMAERLAKGPMEEEEAARIVRDLARGVAHAHARGVLHRDLKPQNVLFDGRGVPKLVDFGLAHVAGARSLTQTGTILGTPCAMAPEQALATERVGPAADVYGLGTLLYQALTGRPPFVRGSVLATLRAVVEDPPAAPSDLRAGLDPSLEALCLSCLAKAPGDRPPSAAALVEALTAWLAGARTHPKSRRRRRALGVALTLGVTSALTVLAFFARARGRDGVAEDAATEAVPPGDPEAGAQAPRAWEGELQRKIAAGEPVEAATIAREIGVDPSSVLAASAPAWTERARAVAVEGAPAAQIKAAGSLLEQLLAFTGTSDAALRADAFSSDGPLREALEVLLEGRMQAAAPRIPKVSPYEAGLEVVRFEEQIARTARPSSWPPQAFKQFMRGFWRNEVRGEFVWRRKVSLHTLLAGEPAMLYACLRVGEFPPRTFDHGTVGKTVEQASPRELKKLLQFDPRGQIGRFVRLVGASLTPVTDPAAPPALYKAAEAVGSARPVELAPEFRAWVELQTLRAINTFSQADKGSVRLNDGVAGWATRARRAVATGLEHLEGASSGQGDREEALARVANGGVLQELLLNAVLHAEGREARRQAFASGRRILRRRLELGREASPAQDGTRGLLLLRFEKRSARAWSDERPDEARALAQEAVGFAEARAEAFPSSKAQALLRDLRQAAAPESSGPPR